MAFMFDRNLVHDRTHDVLTAPAFGPPGLRSPPTAVPHRDMEVVAKTQLDDDELADVALVAVLDGVGNGLERRQDDVIDGGVIEPLRAEPIPDIGPEATKDADIGGDPAGEMRGKPAGDAQTHERGVVLAVGRVEPVEQRVRHLLDGE